jgi:peptide/nickel transport system permease protein
LAAGYYGGRVDMLLSRLVEVFLTLPRLFVLIFLSMLLHSANLPWLQTGSILPVALIIGVFSWMGVARLVRADAMRLHHSEFVQAARVLGASHAHILLRHILPNVASPLIVVATLGLSGAILVESGLSYLGFGVQLPNPTWGNMLSETQNLLTIAPWTAIFPGLAIFIVVLAVNYLGDGLRDALDPHHTRKKNP